MTSADIFNRLNDAPFKPLRIKTTLSDVYEVRERWMIWVGDSSATIAVETRADERGNEVVQRFKTVALAHMVVIEDLAPPKSEGRKSA